MNPLDHIAQLRETYLANLRSVIADCRSKGTLLASEVFLEASEGGDRRRFCADIMTGTKENPQLTMVANEAHEGPLIGALHVGALEIPIFACLWESCRVWFRAPSPPWDLLQQWFAKWADETKSADPVGGDSLSHVVHYVSRPQRDGGGHTFEADFGSAPLEAFTDLLQTLITMGAVEIRIGLPDGSELDPDLAAILRSPDLTPDQLAEVVTNLLKQFEEVESVTTIRGKEPEDLTLEIRRKGADQPSMANLWNLWRRIQRTPPEARNRDVLAQIRVYREGILGTAGEEEKPNLDELRPVIKDQNFVDYVRQRMKSDMAWQPLVADLWVLYVWDSPHGMRFLKHDEPAEYELDLAQTHARALENYLQCRNPVEIHTDGPISVARTADSYDATLLLDNKFWNDLAAKSAAGTPKGSANAAILACVPTRDAVLFTTSGKPGAAIDLRAAAQKMLAGGDHLISATILRWHDGHWEPYIPGVRPAPPTPAASTAPAPKKPRWKFW